MNKWVREINIRMGESPCKPVKRLLYVIDTDEVISEAESKYKEREPLFNSYKQLNDETSLEWFCNPELIKSYEYWDCKNLDKYKPSKAEQEKIKIAGNWVQQNKSLRDQKRKEFETLENLGYLKNANLYAKTIPEIGKLAGIDFDKAYLGSARWAQLQLDHKSARHLARQYKPSELDRLAQQYKPLIEKLRNVQLPNSYISTAETAFKALGGRSSLRDMIDRIQPYQSEVDHILSRGVDAQIARAMYGTHGRVTEDLQLRLHAYEQEEQPKETRKQLRKTIKSKDEEIAELKALLATQKKQDKKIERQTRENQMHKLIWNIDCALRNERRKTPSIEIWNELEKNYLDYEEGEIILSIKNNVIEWRSQYGNESSLAFTSFNSAISKARKKYDNKKIVTNFYR